MFGYIDGLSDQYLIASFLVLYLIAAAALRVLRRRERAAGNGRGISSDDRRGRVFSGVGVVGARGARADSRGADLAAGGRVAFSVVSGGRETETDIKVGEV